MKTEEAGSPLRLRMAIKRPSYVISRGMLTPQGLSKLPTARESEFRDMNQFSGIGIVSLEFRVLENKECYRQFWGAPGS